METISIKLEGSFAREIENTMKKYHYTTKTEFIRESVRDKIKNLQNDTLLQAQMALEDLKHGRVSKF